MRRPPTVQRCRGARRAPRPAALHRPSSRAHPARSPRRIQSGQVQAHASQLVELAVAHDLARPIAVTRCSTSCRPHDEAPDISGPSASASTVAGHRPLGRASPVEQHPVRPIDSELALGSDDQLQGISDRRRSRVHSAGRRSPRRTAALRRSDERLELRDHVVETVVGRHEPDVEVRRHRHGLPHAPIEVEGDDPFVRQAGLRPGDRARLDGVRLIGASWRGGPVREPRQHVRRDHARRRAIWLASGG